MTKKSMIRVSWETLQQIKAITLKLEQERKKPMSNEDAIAWLLKEAQKEKVEA